MQIKAYTLIEMCLVLGIMSGFLLLAPATFHSSSILDFEMNRMLEIIHRAKYNAIEKRESIAINIEHNALIVEEDRYVLSKNITCEPYSFYFNAKGNISMANTVTCSYGQKQMSLVMNIGNGNVYLK